jgi:hypothetical protein
MGTACGLSPFLRRSNHRADGTFDLIETRRQSFMPCGIVSGELQVAFQAN